MKFSPLLSEQRAASGFTHEFEFSYADIPAGIGNNTSQVWGAGYLPALAAGDIVKRVQLHLSEPFELTTDAAFNSDTISVGDTTTATRFVNASEANRNGTEVLNVFPGAVENVIYTAAGQLQVTLNSMAAKSLSNLNRGKAYVRFAIDRAAASSRERQLPFGTGYT